MRKKNIIDRDSESTDPNREATDVLFRCSFTTELIAIKSGSSANNTGGAIKFSLIAKWQPFDEVREIGDIVLKLDGTAPIELNESMQRAADGVGRRFLFESLFTTPEISKLLLMESIRGWLISHVSSRLEKSKPPQNMGEFQRLMSVKSERLVHVLPANTLVLVS